MKEGLPQSRSSEQVPAKAEDVLTDFRRNCELEAGHIYTPQERELISHSLHDKLESLNSPEMLHAYEAGGMPTLDSIHRAAEAAAEVLNEDPTDTEAITHAKLLVGQARHVRGWCRRYVETIIRFHTTRAAFMRMNDEEQRDAFARADSERRRVHDALLNALSTLNRLIARGQELADYRTPISWGPGTDLPDGTAHEHPVIFSADALQDRELIRKWAVIADSVEQLRTVIRKMEESGERETAAP